MTRLGDSFQSVDAVNYDRYRPHYDMANIGAIYKKLGIKVDAVVADVGAGTGFLSIPMMANNIVYHLDASKAMNDIARKKYSEMDGAYYRDRLKIIESDAVNISEHIPSMSVDVVVMSNAAHWFSGDNAAAFKQELEKICKPDAKIIVAYNAYSREDAHTNNVFAEIEALFPSTQGNPGIGGISKAKMENGVNTFISPTAQKRHHDERDVVLSKDEFVGYVGTISFAIKDGIDDSRRQKLGEIYDKYASSDGIHLKLTTDLICGDRATSPSLAVKK